jgi:signal peptidase I
MLGRPYRRGEIVVFYPPAAYMCHELDSDLLHKAGRVTGWPIFPNDPAFIKRVIGLPGDRIRVKAHDGIFVNEKRLNINPATIPEPDIFKFGDIGGRNMRNQFYRPYQGGELEQKAVVVPDGELFVSGDDLNGFDSRTFGTFKQSRVIGRAHFQLYRRFRPITPEQP